MYVNEMARTSGMERVWALLKRGLTSTYRNVNIKHLLRYVDEFAFKLNEGNYQVNTIN